MLNLFCYVILETLNTHLDKLVMAAILSLNKATLSSMGVDAWTIQVY